MSPSTFQLIDALAELDLYADTDEAEEARALVALLDQLDENTTADLR